MKKHHSALVLLAFASVSVAQIPGSWKVIHDKSNACQLAVPADWSANSPLPGSAQAPGNQGDLQVSSSPGKAFKPFNDMTQKALMVGKMLENSEKLVFYSSAPTKSDHPITPYRAIVPGKDGTCSTMVSVRAGVPEETVRKIVATLSVAH
jgi:hypothetical protein